MTKLLTLLLVSILCTAHAYAQKDLRLLSYNIRNAKGMDNKVDYDRIVSVLQKTGAHVIGLQEVDSATKRSGGIDVLQELAAKMKMHGVYGAAMPFQSGKYGVGVLSTEAPLQHYTVPLPGREEPRVLLVVEYKNYVVLNTHFSLTEADRLSSIAIVNAQGRKFTKPIYFMGDLNAEPGSPELTAIKQLWKQLTGDAPTFPAPAPNKCIDYIFRWIDNKPLVHTFTPVEEPLASDHRPILVEVKGKRK
jgi:endonuclease/exonuclease/phosphatase family metal-dependent hydrolase